MSPRLVLLLLALIAAVACVAAQADQYKDCESCVENGWGWSWSKNQCGGYLNTNCDPDSAEALDEEEDEDFSTPAPTQNQQQQQAHASQAHDAHVDDDVPFQMPHPAPFPLDPLEWRNTEQTTHLWQLCNNGDIQSLGTWIYREPGIVHLRAEDGRGPLFWAYEYEKWEMVDFLLEWGADPDATDRDANKPEDLLPAGSKKPGNVKKTFDQAAAMAAAAGRR